MGCFGCIMLVVKDLSARGFQERKSHFIGSGSLLFAIFNTPTAIKPDFIPTRSGLVVSKSDFVAHLVGLC